VGAPGAGVRDQHTADAAGGARDHPDRANGTFDHRDPGTAESVWADSGLWDGIRPVDLDGVSALVVVAAHPDDETLGAGGLIADAAARGIPVTVVVATAGEASHPDSPGHAPVRLAEIRRSELRAAVARLAPAAVVRQLGVPDGAVGSAVDRLALEIGSAVDRPAVEAVPAVPAAARALLLAPWSGDRHPDHAAAAAAARRVAGERDCRLLEYPVWAWHWARPDDGTFVREQLVGHSLSGNAARAKTSAIGEYRSQVLPLSPAAGDEAVVQQPFLDHFRRPVEMFVAVSTEDPGDVSGSAAGGPYTGSPADAAGAAHGASLDRAYFDDFYTGGVDPWGFESRWYETRKRAVTLASLPRERFTSAFEPGCAIGVLTAELAERCDRVLATDIAAAPLERARRRMADVTNVSLQQLRVPAEWPTGSFDLVLLSEIGYYCSADDLSALIRRAVTSLTDDGVLVACHWRHPVTDYPLTGDEVHDRLRRESGLQILAEHREEDFLLDVLVRPPAQSVARREGLLG
jgi:LmbE family N-acetylglucosaminyl deacetylase/SAM-dependent methyltransferase